MDQHVLADLSAYLDQALPAAERSVVEAHLDACGSCRDRLAELRSTARLVAALPLERAPRALVPPLRTSYSWLRSVRSLSMVASGAFALMLIASTSLATGYKWGMDSPTAQRVGGGGAPAAAPAGPPGPAGALQASGTPSTAFSTTKEASATAPAAQDAAIRNTTGATPPAPGGVEAPSRAPLERQEEPQAPPIGPPSLWLALTIFATGLAIYAHRRLRRR